LEEKGEGRKGKGRKGRGGKTRWREGLGPPKNSVVALPMPDTYSWFHHRRFAAGRGKGKGEERNRKGEEGQEGGKVKGKLEQGRRLAKAGPGGHFARMM